MFHLNLPYMALIIELICRSKWKKILKFISLYFFFPHSLYTSARFLKLFRTAKDKIKKLLFKKNQNKLDDVQLCCVKNISQCSYWRIYKYMQIFQLVLIILVIIVVLDECIF